MSRTTRTDYTIDDLKRLSDQYIRLSRSLDNAPASRIRRLRPVLFATQEIITEIAAQLVGRSAIALNRLKIALEKETLRLRALKSELETLKKQGEQLQGIIDALAPIFTLFA